MTTREAGNLTGLVFLIYSLYIFQSFKTNIIIIIVTTIAISSKVFFGFTSMQLIVLFIGYLYCILIYYLLIHPKKPTVKAELEEETTEILQYLIAGLKPKQIADKLNMTTDAVNKQIQRTRDKMEVGNNEQMIYMLSKNGQISQ